MRIALVHDWLTGMRGGEKVLEVLCAIFPRADLYTLLHARGSVSPRIEDRTIFTSFLQNAPGIEKYYRYYLPLMPMAIESFDFSRYDLVISSSHCVAKGVRSPRKTPHICYCHTPMRYIWHMYDAYFGGKDKIFSKKLYMPMIRAYLQSWDVKSSRRVSYFIANSKNVQKRIKECYNREAYVIYPPVDTEKFAISGELGDFYLIVSALVSYKRVDLAIEAFNKLKLPLKVIGSGPEEKRLKKIALPNIEFLGWQPDEKLAEYYSRCRAVIFAGEEDAGIVPLEAMSSGRPVIAYAKGGVVETVIPAQDAREPAYATGVFFNKQTSEDMIEAVYRFQKLKDIFDPFMIRRRALLFDKKNFTDNLKRFIEEKIEDAKKA